MDFDFKKEYLELARLENLYQNEYEKFDEKIDKIRAKQNAVLGSIWDSIIEQKSLIVKNGGVLNDD